MQGTAAVDEQATEQYLITHRYPNRAERRRAHRGQDLSALATKVERRSTLARTEQLYAGVNVSLDLAKFREWAAAKQAEKDAA